MDRIADLIAVADGYGAATGLECKTVSWRVFGDTKKLAALRAGGDIQTRRFAQAMTWLSDNWPEGADWPDGVVRPTGRGAVHVAETTAPAPPVSENITADILPSETGVSEGVV